MVTTAQEPDNTEHSVTSLCHCCSLAKLRKMIWGAIITSCLAGLWVGSSHMARLTLQGMNAAFFMTWFTATWNILFFPVYYVGSLPLAHKKETPLKQFRKWIQFLSADDFTLRACLKKMTLFAILWTLTNYLYFLALKKISITEASALFCCSKAFVFLLSWIILKDKFMGVRIVAVIFSISGIVMMSYADGFQSDSITGVALLVGSSLASALYKVLFKLLMREIKSGETSVFLSALGVFNALFLLWIPVILYVTKVEYWSSAYDIPWEHLCGLAGFLLTFNIVMNFGANLTYPIVNSFGIFLSVPTSAENELGEKIRSAQETLYKNSQDSLIDVCISELIEQISCYERKLLQMKQKKLKRGVADFQKGNVFVWLKEQRVNALQMERGVNTVRNRDQQLRPTTSGSNEAVLGIYTNKMDNFSNVRTAATVIICTGFLLLLLPEDWDEAVQLFCTRLQKKKITEEGAETNMEVGIHSWTKNKMTAIVTSAST
ncbi:putative thiamine transporter SLC35F3 [Protopterus annectens]|uniref:putative thiamine transporter SLC35F3 n=1 Tax=Protopterus annectens TaxID=7888 RepID=UPI001CF98514|nr:putative thiamine transporter SLC35F3 [Protopterus annectens]